jgi:uncharacterized membrane protein YbhN (UPF0104 family)
VAKRFKWFLKVAFSAAMLAWVLYQVPWQDFKALPAEWDWPWLLPAFILYVISKVISAYRAGQLLQGLGYSGTFRMFQRLYFKGMYYNLLLPGGVSGDGWKVWFLKGKKRHGAHDKSPVKALLGAVFFDRLSGAVALAVWSLILGAFLFPAYAWLAGLLLAGGLAIFKGMTHRWFRSFVPGWWQGLGLSLLAQGLAGLTGYLLWLAMAQPGPPGLLILSFFIANLASVLPVTFGGIGLREWVFIQFAGPHLMSYLWVALCFTGIHTAVSLVGAFLGKVAFEEGEVSEKKPQP